MTPISELSQLTSRLQIININQYLSESRDSDVCSICLESGFVGSCSDNVYNDQSKFKTTCSHVFHYKCIRRWCSSNNCCPMCRTENIFDLQNSVLPLSAASTATTDTSQENNENFYNDQNINLNASDENIIINNDDYNLNINNYHDINNVNNSINILRSHVNNGSSNISNRDLNIFNSILDSLYIQNNRRYNISLGQLVD